jgi:hypothetical protein
MSIHEAKAFCVRVRYTYSPWYSIRLISSWIDRDQFQSRSRFVGRRESNFRWCLLIGAPSLGSSSDAPELSYRPLCLFPLSLAWSSSLARFLLQPLARSPRWSSPGILLRSPPCRLLCHPQSLTLVMTGRLDLLWLLKQPGCD